MNTLIKLYQNATANAQDGDEVSISKTFTAPIQFRLDAAINETKTMPIGIRTATGYQTVNDVVISIVGDADNHFSLCTTQNGTFSTSITMSGITDTNKIFYVKAASSDTDYPVVNRDVSVKVYAPIRVASS